MPASAVLLCGIPDQNAPVPGTGPWSITGTVRIPSTCQFSWNNDIHILGYAAGALFIEGGTLTVNGWINITQGGVLDMTQGAQLHVPPGNPAARLRVSNGASFHADTATIELEGLDAPGTSNQGNIQLINVSVTARGVFSANTNSLHIERSTVNVTVPASPAGLAGNPGVLNLGGRIVGLVSESTILLQAGAGGAGTQGAQGFAGGSATSAVQAKTFNYVTMRIAAGNGGAGGTGPPGGVSGGLGGAGGSTSFTMNTDLIANSAIDIIGGAGAVGGHGGVSSNGSGGDGGAGRPGGSSTATIRGYSDLQITGSTIRVSAGPGGTGGSGGDYEGNVLTDRGGDAANGAQGGAATGTFDSAGSTTISQSTIRCAGGPGGLGGAYGSSQVSSALSSGRAGTGGAGGTGTCRTDSSIRTLQVVDSTITAIGGAGGTGGEGKLEGGSGGDGANSLAAGFGLFGVDLHRSCYIANGGPGGIASTGELASGHGGKGGKGNVTITSDGGININGGCLRTRSGQGGAADPGRAGANGLEADLWVDSDRLEIRDATIGNPLNDYSGTQAGLLYNVTFALENQGQSPVIPRGAAPIWSYWNLSVLVTDGVDPIPGVAVSIETCPSIPGDPMYDFKQTDANGRITFTLVSHKYTSQTNLSSFVGCYDVESSYEGQSADTEHVTLEANHNVLFLYPANNYAPTITFLQPTASIYRVDADHPNIPLEIIVADPDDPITGVPSDFTVWACIAREATCFDRTDITDSLVQDPNTGEKRYYALFNVTNVNEFPSGQYFVCAKAYDGLIETVWHCTTTDIVQVIAAVPEPEISAGGIVRDDATEIISFTGRINNIDTLQAFTPPISIMIYRWDFDGDGRWDYYSTTSGQTSHLYPNSDQTITYRANFSVVDSLGRESDNVTREVTIDPFVVEPPGFLWEYAYVIVYTIAGAIAATGSAYTLQRRRARQEEEEAKRREAEILANIHECQRCGDLLPAKFAVCIRCATEDSIASVKKTVAELKHVGVIVLEEEDIIDKAYVSFESRDFETANQFLDKVKSRVEVNRKRHKATTENIRRKRLHIHMLEEQGKDLAVLEPELYHAELALGRSDFDGADQMVETIALRLQAVVYEDKRKEILERFSKLERKLKAGSLSGDAEAKHKFDKATELLQRAKLALGKKSYVESVGYFTEAFTLVEGAPPDAIVTEPTVEELDLFETRMKMVQEGVYMGPAAPATAATEKVWRPGEKEFVVEAGADYKPGEHAGTMGEDQAHGRDFAEEAHAPAPEPKRSAPPVWEPAPEPVQPEPEPPAPPVAEMAPPAAKVEEVPRPAPEVLGTAPPAPSTAPAAALNCSSCGTPLKAGWRRCPKCSTPVPSASSPAAPSGPAPASEPSALALGAKTTQVPPPAPKAPEVAPPAAKAEVAPAPAPAQAAAANCSVCGTKLNPAWKRCPKCATPVPGASAAPATPQPPAAPAAPATAAPAAAAPANCPNCKKPVKANWKKCPYCATQLS